MIPKEQHFLRINQPFHPCAVAILAICLGASAIYDAPELWGPWTTVLFEQDRVRWGSKVVVFNFVNKWLSADGRRFVLVYTKNDHWASLEGEFLTAP